MPRFVFRAGRRSGGAALPTLLLVVLAACSGAEPKPTPAAVSAPANAPGTTVRQGGEGKDDDPDRGVRYGWVILESGESIFAELADTPAKQQRGFMFREVARDDAMLFLFPFETYHSIWMKNCLSALDVIWLDRLGRVVHLEENLPPCPAAGECPGYGPMQASLYVLELAAGEAKRRGIGRGSTLQVVLQNRD